MKANSLNNLSKLLGDKERKSFYLLVFQMIIVALLEFVGIALVLPFIKLAGDKLDISTFPTAFTNWIEQVGKQNVLIYSGAVIFVLIVLSTILKIYLAWREQKFVWDISHRLGLQQHRNILAKPYAFFIEKNSSEIMTNLIVETSTTVRGILLPIAQIISNAFIGILFLSLITFLHPKVSLIFISLSIIVGVILIITLRSKLEQLGKKRLTLERSRFMLLKESVIGIKTVKSSQKEMFFLNKFSGVSFLYSKIKPFINTLNSVPKSILDIILFGGVILLVTVLLWQKKDITNILPTLTFYVLVGFKLMPTFQNIINAIITIRFSWPSLKPVFEGLEKTDDSHLASARKSRINFNKNLVLSNCYFSHQADNYILKDISLEIKKGQKVGIVGYSGAGKTTLVEILSGLLQPNSGQIKLDGKNISKNNIYDLMQLISFVPQDVFFFDDSILKNITLEENDAEIDHKKMDQILDILKLSDFMNELQHGLTSNVGEHGVKLSGGQKQRLGFARALYKDPEILVLDESTSALDYLTEQELLASLKQHRPELTILKVAHRLKSVKDCDVIYFLDHGEVVASGTFDEITQNNNLFKEMVEAGTI